MIKEIEIYPNDNTYVLFDIGKHCNFNCSYCIQYKKENNPPKISDEIIRKRCEEMVAKISDKEKISFCCSGGEPTTHNLIYCLEPIKKLDTCSIRIVTNFSAKNDDIKNYYKYFDNFIFTLSVHDEYWTIDNLKNKFKEIYNFINDNKYEFPKIQITITNKNFEISKKFIEMFKINFPKCSMVIDLDKSKYKNNSKEMMEFVKNKNLKKNKKPYGRIDNKIYYNKQKLMADFQKSNLISMKGWKCKLTDINYFYFKIDDKTNELLFSNRNCGPFVKEDIVYNKICNKDLCSFCSKGVKIGN